MACVDVEALDDGFIESQETITVTTEPRNKLDQVSGTTNVNIMDNDGKGMTQYYRKQSNTRKCY